MTKSLLPSVRYATKCGIEQTVSPNLPMLDAINMDSGKYRIITSTIVLIPEDGRHVAYSIPTGAVVSVDSGRILQGKLLSVKWGGVEAIMFLQDLQSRAERIEEERSR